MSFQSFQETIAWQDVAAASKSNYTTPISVIDPSALVTLPPNWWKPGRILRIITTGAISNIVTTPGLMNFQVKVGSVAAFDTGNIQLNASAHTTLPFWLEMLLTCRAKGSGTSANLMGMANVTGKMFTRTAGQTDDAQGDQSLMVPQGAPAVGTGFDSTIANTLDFFAGFTIANAGNLVQIHQYLAMALN
jgi:hypothetical protein